MVRRGASKNVAAVVFNLNLTGEFRDVLKFIYLIENTTPYASLRTIQIGAGGSSASQNQGQSFATQSVDARTSIKVYTH